MEFQKACTDICFIIDNLVKEDRERIPETILEFFRENRDVFYMSKIDINKQLFEQELDETTRAFLYILFFQYFANEEEKNDLKRYFENKENLYISNISPANGEEVEKNEDVFVEEIQKKQSIQKETEMVVKKYTIFDKIKKFIKSLFN